MDKRLNVPVTTAERSGLRSDMEAEAVVDR